MMSFGSFYSSSWGWNLPSNPHLHPRLDFSDFSLL